MTGHTLGAVGVLLIVACANVANLLLFGVQPRDPLVFAGIGVLLASVD